MCICLSDALLDACYVLRLRDRRRFIPHSRSQHVVWSTNYVIVCPIISSPKATNILLSMCFRTTSVYVVTRVLIRLRFKVFEAVLLVLKSPGMVLL